mgnify:CR=1 FL=1
MADDPPTIRDDRHPDRMDDDPNAFVEVLPGETQRVYDASTGEYVKTTTSHYHYKYDTEEYSVEEWREVTVEDRNE